MIFELAGDFGEVLSAIPEHHSRRRLLYLLEESIRRDIQFVALHPTTLFQCLWNTCWWYDCPLAAQHYVEPGEGWQRSPDQPAGSKLHSLLDTWRDAREATFPGWCWLRSIRPPQQHLGTAQRAMFRHEHGVVCVDCSADGRQLATGSGDAVRLWDAENGDQLAIHRRRVSSLAFSPDGRSVAGGSGVSVSILDAQNGVERMVLTGHGADVTSVAFAPDGRRLVGGSGDGTVRVWDVDSGVVLTVLRGHEDRVRSVAFSPDSRRIASGAQDGTVRIWDARSGQELAVLGEHKHAVSSVAFSKNDGLRIASGFADGAVRIWDVQSGKELVVAAPRRGNKVFVGVYGMAVTSVDFSPDNRQIVSGGADHMVRVWDGDSGAELAVLRGHQDWVRSVVFLPDGWRVASAADDGTVRIWDTREVAELAVLPGHQADVKCVAYSSDGQRVASGSFDRTVRVWNARNGTPLTTLKGHEASVNSVAFSADGQRVFSGADDATVRVWNRDGGDAMIILKGHTGGVTIVAAAPDGRVASGARDNTVRVWNAHDGRELVVLRGHQDDVTRLAFSPDGRHLVSGGGGFLDTTVRVWDLETSECLEVFEQGDVVALAASCGASPAAQPGLGDMPWQARGRGLETVVQLTATGEEVAWFPTAATGIQIHPTGNAWAVWRWNQLYLVQLEGVGSSTPARNTAE